ncbi:MAG: MoxR family ATPase [Methylococcaceae bacterium]|nr:MoxR family ATPase [Methylococcaceae bacterium]
MDVNLSTLFDSANQVILGKEHQIKLAVCCLLARGHLLIEDIPGVGKTTLSHTLAKLLGLDYQRIQFTSDIMPADIIGSSIFNASKSEFTFHPGPIFNQMVLADEINRATPRAQSALLEAMEENQVTVEGVSYDLPSPFFVIATQNPSHQLGTFSLPESQLDRFLMRIQLGYPDQQAERNLLTGVDRRFIIDELQVMLPPERLSQMQNEITGIYTSPALLDYVQALINFTRESDEFNYGLSPRAGLALLTAAKSWAYMKGGDAVLPEDVQTVLPAVAGHRLKSSNSNSDLVVESLLQHVEVS